MNKVLPYFSFQGRANRSRFWLTVLILYAALFGGILLSVPFVLLGPAQYVVEGVVVIAFLVAAVANSVRRLHDRNRSGWWLLLIAVVPAILSVFGQALMETESGQGLGAIFALLSLPLSLWAFVELGCLKGTTGPNRFGADPLQPLEGVFA